MNDLLLPLIITGLGVLVALGQLVIKQGEVGLQEQAVKVGERALGLELARQNSVRLAQVEAQNLTLSVQFTALTGEYTKMITQATTTHAELDVTRAKLEISERKVAELTQKVHELENENTKLHVELETLRKRLNGVAD
jgi:chromosome segregation ATPase